MDEITLVNLLNKICEHSDTLDWRLNCTYDDGLSTSIMKIVLFDRGNQKKYGYLAFRMETATMIAGKYKQLMPFKGRGSVVDALLDILHYETATKLPSYN
ncbi:hypothetical protein [Marinoscillum sp. MHG1-6]|uniref:hypothetical protein n=1 Tax=Marinoscillum sp. MHG1-6 TaxID=2959627 RepID=UPI002157CCAA|nr:hypothetical protein [Marinoscillum sp. MHG1-6]